MGAMGAMDAMDAMDAMYYDRVAWMFTPRAASSSM